MARHTFIYDDACPMCQAYTQVFTDLKWSNRLAFSEIGEEEFPALDLDRGRHEIPLLDEQTGTFRYGLDAMTLVVAKGFPLLRPLLRNPIILFALRPLYGLITYNRRIIAGTQAPKTGFDCAPDQHLGWRLLYVVLILWAAFALGMLPPLLNAGYALAFFPGFILSKDRFTMLGHFVTVFFLASAANAIFPDEVGYVAAYIVTAIEIWRRLR